MGWLRHDFRLAVRMLGRRPGFSLLAILTLALGLSVNTVAFSAVNALLFKPFRFAGADRTGWLFVATARDPLANTSVAVFEALERGATTIDAVAAEGRMPLAFDAGTVTEEIWALFVSPEYFSLVGTTPLAGRTIGGTDGTNGDVPVLVSERFWQRRLDADPRIGSLPVRLNQRQAVVVGVLPDGFQGPGGVFEPDVWVPLAARHTLNVPARYLEPGAGWLTLLARPKPDVPAAAVEQEVLAVATAAGLAARDANDALRAQYVRFADGHPETRALARAAAGGMAAVGVVLLIACFNVAGLVLARSVERRREFGLRAALGAGRWRIARQQLTESLVLAGAGGVAALLLALWSERLLSVFSLPAPIPQRLHFAYDWRVLSFTAALALVATIVPALAPVLQAARADLARSLGTAGAAQGGGFGHRRTRRAFVLLQVAGSTCFLALALIFGAHFVREWRMDPGFDVGRLAVMEIDPSQYGYTPERARELADGLVASARTARGVRNVAVADRVSFFVGVPTTRPVSLDDRDCAATDCPQAGVYAAAPEFFDTMGIPLVLGRVYDPDSPADRDAVVISATAAETFWPGEYPVGRSFRLEPDARTLTVAGVAADIVHRGMNERRQSSVYRPLAPADFGASFTVVARAADDVDAALAALGQGVHAIDPRLPPQSLETMRDRMALPLWMPRTAAGFFGACGAAAVLLSTIGLFGVTYFAVSQRRREFGVRFALGATRADVRRLVFGETFRLAGPGILAGSGLAVIAAFAIRSALLGLATGSPTPYVAAVLVQGAIAALASWSPAARAARSSPLEVLRAE
jgi:predicted permease